MIFSNSWSLKLIMRLRSSTFMNLRVINIQVPEIFCRLLWKAIRLFVRASRLPGIVLLNVSSRLTRDQPEESHSIHRSSTGIDFWILFPNQISRAWEVWAVARWRFPAVSNRLAWEAVKWRIG